MKWISSRKFNDDVNIYAEKKLSLLHVVTYLIRALLFPGESNFFFINVTFRDRFFLLSFRISQLIVTSTTARLFHWLILPRLLSIPEQLGPWLVKGPRKPTKRRWKCHLSQIKLSLISRVQFSTKVLQNLFSFGNITKMLDKDISKKYFLVNKYIFGTNVSRYSGCEHFVSLCSGQRTIPRYRVSPGKCSQQVDNILNAIKWGKTGLTID